MATTVIDLAAWKATKKVRVKGPPRVWQCVPIESIPPQKKGIVSGGVLRCPECGTPCLTTAPSGRGSRKWRARAPICGFGCAWRGQMHLCDFPDHSLCPGCAQNPRVVTSG